MHAAIVILQGSGPKLQHVSNVDGSLLCRRLGVRLVATLTGSLGSHSISLSEFNLGLDRSSKLLNSWIFFELDQLPTAASNNSDLTCSLGSSLYRRERRCSSLALVSY